jgi:hypothetical protein
LHLECCVVLYKFFLHVDAWDRLKWYPNPNTGYSISGAYRLLTRLVPLAVATQDEITWNNIDFKCVPFSWRLLNNRLYHQKIIWFVVEWLFGQIYVHVVVESVKPPTTYFFGVTFLNPYLVRLFMVAIKYRCWS